MTTRETWNISFSASGAGIAGNFYTQPLLQGFVSRKYRLLSADCSVRRSTAASVITTLNGYFEITLATLSVGLGDVVDRRMTVQAGANNSLSAFIANFDSGQKPKCEFDSVILDVDIEFIIRVTMFAPSGSAFIATDGLDGNVMLTVEAVEQSDRFAFQ